MSPGRRQAEPEIGRTRYTCIGIVFAFVAVMIWSCPLRPCTPTWDGSGYVMQMPMQTLHPAACVPWSDPLHEDEYSTDYYG